MIAPLGFHFQFYSCSASLLCSILKMLLCICKRTHFQKSHFMIAMSLARFDSRTGDSNDFYAKEEKLKNTQILL